MVRQITRKKGGFLALIAALLILGACANQDIQANAANNNLSQTNSNHLDLVKERGKLICGVSGELPGFSFVDANGNYAGMDVDLCRAIAAAIFDDPKKVVFRDLSAAERFDVLKSGEIDLLSRNTTQTLSRDTEANFDFTPVVFYDNQGILVSQDSKIKSVANLNNKSICVADQTTSYDNLRDYMAQKKIKYQAVASSDIDSLYNSYEHNRCQAITGDISQLIARKSVLANPKEHHILPQKISQEPLAPVLLNQDSQWFDVVKWITFALVEAEELGIDSENLSTYKNSKDSEIRRFLGLEGNLGAEMSLSNDFTAKIIKHVGNYGEIFERNVGQPFGLSRGSNALWKDGGLMYSPPFN